VNFSVGSSAVVVYSPEAVPYGASSVVHASTASGWPIPDLPVSAS
jgi:hypothetical protein